MLKAATCRTIDYSNFYCTEHCFGISMLAQPDDQSVPLFCVKTTEKNSGHKLFINFKASNQVQAPDVAIDEDKIVREICDPSPNIENYKIPLVLSQLFWSAKEGEHQEGDNIRTRNYVIDIKLNEKFALRKVIPSDIMRHYLITIAMISIEGKYNGSTGEVNRQFVGHALELDQASYEILKDQQYFDRSNELVSNKIVLLEKASMKSVTDDISEKLNFNEQVDDSTSYDLHFRPASMILTCSLTTPKLPESIAFNDDTIRIGMGKSEKATLEIVLPLKIDLTQPVKYKFDDKLCLLRIVFKVLATLEPV